MIQIGAVSLGWSGTPLPQVFTQLAAIGGECVDINSRTDRHHGLILNRETIPQVRAWAANAGLTIASMAGYSDFAQEDAAAIDAEIAQLLDTCRVAAEMGVPVVRAFVGDVKPGGKKYADYRPVIVEAFGRATAAARALGVTLGIENHGRLLNNGPALVALLREVGAPNLGITLDTGNFAWAGRNPAQTEVDLESVLPHTVCVHVKDGVWTRSGFKFLPVGEGALNIAGLLRRLKATGYAGAIYSEYEGPGEFLEGTRKSLAYIKQALQEAG